MSVIYLSPYYSMLDYSLALEGVYGFRYFDRYGGNSIDTHTKAYEPSSASSVDALQPVDISNWGSQLEGSLDWYDGFKLGLGIFEGVEPNVRFDITYANTDNVVSIGSIPFPVSILPSAGVNLTYYTEVDSSLATATLTQSWIEGAGLLATQGGNASLWYYAIDSSSATATLTQSWIEGVSLIATNVYYPYKSSADAVEHPLGVYIGTVSTVVAPLKNFSLEGAVLNSGGLVVSSGGNWASWYCASSTTVSIYYEIRVDTVSNHMYGFTTGTTANNGLHYNSQITSLNYVNTDQNQTEFAIYANQLRGLSVGDVYGMYLDIPNRKIEFYVNGILTYLCINIPVGKTWRPCLSLHSSQSTLRFDSASWTHKPMGIPSGYSPGGLVDGFAKGFYPLALSEDDVALNLNNIYLDTLTTVVESLKVGNLLEGTTLNNGLLTTPNTSWTSYYSLISTTKISYYEVRIDSVNHVMIGFTTGTTANNGQYYDDYSQISAAAPIYAITNQSQKDFVIYANQLRALSVNDVYGVYLDIFNRTITWYINGVLTYKYTNIPEGKTWRACISQYYSTSTVRFNYDSWTYKLLNTVDAIGGLVDSEKRGVYQFNLSEDDAVEHPLGVYIGTVSTVVAPLKNFSLEGAVLNSGGLVVSSGGNWTSWYCTSFSTESRYYEIRVDTVSTHVYGFCTTTNPPSNGSYYDNNVINALNYINTDQNKTEFAIYANSLRGLSVGEVYGFYLDIPNRKIEFYINGVLTYSCINIPIGKTWRPCLSLHSSQSTLRFNSASWTHLPIGLSLDYSPGGLVDGFAKGFYPLALSEDDSVYTPLPIYLDTVSTVVAPAKYYTLEGAKLNNSLLTVPYTGGWSNYYSNISSSNNIYYEIVCTGVSVMFGFIEASRTSPVNGSYYNGVTWLTLGNSPYNGSGLVEFIYYDGGVTNFVAGDILGAYFDNNNRTITLYRNNVVVGSYNNIPSGMSLKPASSTISSVTYRFDYASMTYKDKVFNSPSVIVDGFAKGVYEVSIIERNIGNTSVYPANSYTLIYNSIPTNLVTTPDIWGSSKYVGGAKSSLKSYYLSSPNLVGSTGVTSDVKFKDTYELLASVGSNYVYWDYRIEEMLYPLKTVDTNGLSNTVSVTVEV